MKKRKKCFVFSVKRQKKGPKIKEVKVYTFTFFPKMAIFEKLPILTNRKKRKKWDFDQIEKSWYQKISGTRESENPGTREFLVKISLCFLVIKIFSLDFLKKIDRKKNFIFIFLPVSRNPYRDFYIYY